LRSLRENPLRSLRLNLLRSLRENPLRSLRLNLLRSSRENLCGLCVRTFAVFA